jgi:hypothetical protein
MRVLARTLVCGQALYTPSTVMARDEGETMLLRSPPLAVLYLRQRTLSALFNYRVVFLSLPNVPFLAQQGQNKAEQTHHSKK